MPNLTSSLAEVIWGSSDFKPSPTLKVQNIYIAIRARCYWPLVGNGTVSSETCRIDLRVIWLELQAHFGPRAAMSAAEHAPSL